MTHPLLILAASSLSGGALASPERMAPPAYSIAAEDEVGTAWVNPGNLGFNPDPSLGLWFRQGLTEQNTAFAAATSAGGTSLGVLYRYDPEANEAWWGLNSALSIGFPGRVRGGANVTWSLPDGEGNNFVSYDLGVGWRPVSYVGVGGTLRNLGNPAPALGVETAYGVGAVLRPFNDVLEIGFDFEDKQLEQDPTYAGVVHLKPVEGLDIRLRGDQKGNLSGGLTVWFGGAGAGAYYDLTDADGSGVIGHLTSGIGDERLAGLGSRVPVIAFDRSFGYQPTSSFFSAAGESYLHLLERLAEAAADRSVRGVVLKLDATPFSYAQMAELQAAVAELQARDKPVIAYLDGSASNGAYMLASGCDRVYMHPAGDLSLIGLSSELMYFKGVFDLVGVEPQFARRAEYKSAVEQYTNTEPSDPSREQMDALLDDLFAHMLESVSEGRDIEIEELKGIIDEGPFTPTEAIAAGLVDETLYPDELEEKIEEVIDTLHFLDEDYAMVDTNTGWEISRQIAVIYVDGPIVSGESATPGFFSGGSAGADTISRALMQAAELDSVRAVVLRVDSPGGSAFASDNIWRAVEKVKEEGKPVIVSMGGVAASGGYYVAAGADAIYAEETTITGSIGIYSGKMSFGELYEKVGLNTELFTRGRNAAMYSVSRPMDAIEYAAMDRMISHGYTQFKERVAAGRGMTMEEVEQVARGRVWSGSRAKEIGLVDELGGLQDAIERARQDAGIGANAEVDLITIRGVETAFGDPVIERVQALFRPQIAVPELPEELARLQPYLALEGETLLAMSPWIIEIK